MCVRARPRVCACVSCASLCVCVCVRVCVCVCALLLPRRYFLLQSDDYVTLKQRVFTAIATGAVAKDVAGIDVAIENLRICEYLTPLLQAQLAE